MPTKTTDKPQGETKVADDSAETQSNLVLDHVVKTAKVQTQFKDKDKVPKVRRDADGDEIEEILDALQGITSSFPHANLPPGSPFDPFNAAYTTREFCHVDEDYLLAHLHDRPTLDMSAISWKPQEISDFQVQRRADYDLETEGFDSEKQAITMIGINLHGVFGDIQPRYQKLFDSANTGGLIFTYNQDTHSEPGSGFVLETMKTTRKRGKDFEAIQKTYGVIYCKDEADMLTKHFRFMESLHLSIISLHNGYDFDLPFVTNRCRILGIDCPWTTVITLDRATGLPSKLLNSAASMDGKPMEFYPTYWARPNRHGRIWNDGTFPQFIDTQHLAGQHDKLMGDMAGYSLKYLAADYLKGRDGRRIELSYTAMMEAWQKGDPAKLKRYREYLIYDLEDQDIISRFFLLNIWYQQMFMPLPLQAICTASPARKWSSIMAQSYDKLYGTEIARVYNGVASKKKHDKPNADVKVKYTGAISRVSPGVYYDFYKVDVASLYPSIMLRWLISESGKDPLGLILYILIQARELRYFYKKLGNETSDTEKKKGYKAIDMALKVLLNGCYGFFGTGGYETNSMRGAAIVTAYGRILMRIMMHVAKRYHRIIEVDTDGLLIQVVDHDGPPNAECVALTKKLLKKAKDKLENLQADPNADEESIEKAKGSVARHKEQLEEMLDESRGEREIYTPEYVHSKMQEVLPSGSKDPNATSIEKVGIVLELEEIYKHGLIFAGKAKNYIKFDGPEAKPKLKGIYRKRNRTPIQKKHLVRYIQILGFYGKDEADLYRNAVINGLHNLSYELATAAGETVDLPVLLDSGKYVVSLTLEDITSTHRIPSTGTWLPECNMGLAGGDEKVSYYWGHLKKRGVPTKTNPLGKYIKGREFPIRVAISDQWEYTVNQQYIPDTFVKTDITAQIDHIRYVEAFLKSIAKVDQVVEAGKSRTSMTIDDEDLKLPQWFIDKIDGFF